MALIDKVRQTWETWSDREYVIRKHLEPYYGAQEGLANLIASEATNTPVREIQNRKYEFLRAFLVTLMMARIKIAKYTTDDNARNDDKQFKEQLEACMVNILTDIQNHKDIKTVSIMDFLQKLHAVGLLYDRLGYNSPEQKKIRTPILSDIDIGVHEPEQMEEE